MAPEGNEDAATLLKRFYYLQEERVETYRMLDEGHSAYLKGAPNYNFPMYRQLIHEITQTFKKISDEIMSIEENLKTDHKKNAVASFISAVQEEEKNKLEVTVKLQLAKQNVQDHPEVDSHKQEVLAHEQFLRDVKERINEHLEELKYESEDFMSEDCSQET